MSQSVNSLFRISKNILQARSHILITFIVFSLMWIYECDGDSSSTVSPPSDFIMAPQNKTVLEGHPAILKCKMTDIVQKCQWFYLQFGMNIFDERFQPVLVKEFRPTQNRDCSIKLSKTRLVQSGQWICKGLQIHAFKYVVSPPAFLTIIGPDSEYSTENYPEGRTGNGIEFRRVEEGYIVNANLGEAAVVSCYANQELSSCSWIKPDGLTIHSGDNGNYRQEGNMTDGNCSLYINRVTSKDEGNWRCVVSGFFSQGDKVGPVVHLHIHELGEHSEGIERFFLDGNNTSSLPMILGITSVILVAVIIALVFVIYKRMWRISCYDKYIATGGSEKSDYSNYDVSWHPELRNRDQGLLEGQSCRSSNASGSFSRPGYLDMGGRSSMASRTTLSTLPIGCDTKDPTLMIMNDKSRLSARSTPADINLIQGRKLPEINSNDDQDHLYEEIKYGKSDGLGNLGDGSDEIDKEGYLIPSHCSSQNTMEHRVTAENCHKDDSIVDTRQQPPPFTEVNTNVHCQEPSKSEGSENLATSSNFYDEHQRNESYDIPKETPFTPPLPETPLPPSIPERIDSKEGPLANYDVPVKFDRDSLSIVPP